MKRSGWLAALVGILCMGVGWADDGAWTGDQGEVVRVVRDAYVDGIHNFRRVEAVRRGFHPGFEMLILRDDSLAKLPIGDWIENLERANRTNPLPENHTPTVEANFLFVEVTGDVAVVGLELVRQEKVIFTDYLSLYRFSDGWRIVGKVFHRHP